MQRVNEKKWPRKHLGELTHCHSTKNNLITTVVAGGGVTKTLH